LADHRRGARHVLDNDIRIAGNEFRHELSEHARVQVVGVTGFGADDNCNRFSLIKWGLSLGVAGRGTGHQHY
jgi:hypothetical protein